MASPRARAAGALVLLGALAPVNAAVTGLLVALGGRPRRRAPARPLTVLVSGGKMTKALALARCFHAAGHRVVLCETAPYRWSGHRFSRAVAAFHVVPAPSEPGYVEAMARLVREENVDVFVPVSSPASSVPEADLARAVGCEVFHLGSEDVRALDDKFAFCRTAARLGLPAPDVHRVTDTAEAGRLATTLGGRYVLKSIPYDPVNRLDLRPATPELAATKPIAPDRPWVLQAWAPGKEWCTHSTVRDGQLRLHSCCESSAFQLNYEHRDHPVIEAWVRDFVGALRLTGQVSFDFMEAADGSVTPIECNPRTHSAITQFGADPRVADAYLGDGLDTLTPSGKPTYWLYQELWRLVRGESSPRKTLRTLRRGRDAIFSRRDPLPFFMVHHVHVPILLLRILVSGRDWVRVDFNIGKLVAPGGD